MTTLNTAAIDTLLERLRALMDGDARRDALLYIGRRVGVAAEGYGRAYPERKEGARLPMAYTRTTEAKHPYKLKNGLIVGRAGEQFQSQFKSLKQQRKVFALIGKGKVPRTRTGFLGNSITSEAVTDGEGVLISVGSKLTYAPYVIGGADTQNDYLASLGWQSLPQTLDDHVAELRAVVVDSLQAYMDGYVSEH